MIVCCHFLLLIFYEEFLLYLISGIYRRSLRQDIVTRNACKIYSFVLFDYLKEFRTFKDLYTSSFFRSRFCLFFVYRKIS